MANESLERNNFEKKRMKTLQKPSVSKLLKTFGRKQEKKTFLAFRCCQREKNVFPWKFLTLLRVKFHFTSECFLANLLLVLCHLSRSLAHLSATNNSPRTTTKVASEKIFKYFPIFARPLKLSHLGLFGDSIWKI